MQRIGDREHARHPGRPPQTPEPRRGHGGVGRTHDQRPRRVDEPAGHLARDAGKRQRHAGRARQHPRVAERALRAGRLGIDQRDSRGRAAAGARRRRGRRRRRRRLPCGTRRSPRRSRSVMHARKDTGTRWATARFDDASRAPPRPAPRTARTARCRIGSGPRSTPQETHCTMRLDRQRRPGTARTGFPPMPPRLSTLVVPGARPRLRAGRVRDVPPCATSIDAQWVIPQFMGAKQVRSVMVFGLTRDGTTRRLFRTAWSPRSAPAAFARCSRIRSCRTTASSARCA